MGNGLYGHYGHTGLEICVFVCWLCFGTTFIDAQLGPQVTSVSPTNSPATGGGVQSLLIEGSRFGSVKALVSVSVGTFNSAQITFLADTFVGARLPPGVGAGLSVKVLVEGFPGIMAAIFSYDAPVLTAVLPSVVPTSGGVVTVLGLNFGISNYGQSSSTKS